ncbi:MAG: hypothetical protein WDZ75_01225 [Candidatus Paceibacterota bacterium]
MQKKRRENTRAEDILCVMKKRGESMGELVARIRNEQRISDNEKVTFAGRLDPLASGVVLLLKNDMRFEKESFLSLPKKYEFEVILGVETDTLDVLGKITKIENKEELKNLDEVCNTTTKSLHSLLGEQIQTYPKYSSKTVNGKPLFEYARENIEIERPTRTVTIFRLNLLSLCVIPKSDLLHSVTTSVGSVMGDFRQEEILRAWHEQSYALPRVVTKMSFNVECSTGTYVRVLATKIASLLNTCAIADNICRVKLGEFTS